MERSVILSPSFSIPVSGHVLPASRAAPGKRPARMAPGRSVRMRYLSRVAIRDVEPEGVSILRM